MVTIISLVTTHITVKQEAKKITPFKKIYLALSLHKLNTLYVAYTTIPLTTNSERQGHNSTKPKTLTYVAVNNVQQVLSSRVK